MKCDFVCHIEKLVFLLSFEPSEVFPAYTLGYHRKENYNNVSLEAQRHRAGFCSINREKVTCGANALYVKLGFAPDVLYMRVTSHVTVTCF